MISPDRIAKAKWQCRRGMLELDLILARFVEHALSNLKAEEFVLFEKLLDASDPELYSWVMGHDYPEDKELKNFVEFIKMYDYPENIS